MAMGVGQGKGLTADINMTPMIDVLLVLIIIFMLVTQAKPNGLDALVPQPNPRPQEPPPVRTIVIQVQADHLLKINQEVVTEQTLGSRLQEIFKARAEKVAFVKGDDNVEFREVARVIDIAKGAGVEKIGLVTAKIEQGL